MKTTIKFYQKKKKRYSLGDLLSKQPKTLKKDSYYDEMIHRLLSSGRLQKLRINKRCYQLLDKVIIKPEHLQNFYSTYKLPNDPFFPLFCKIKKDYLFKLGRKRSARFEYIKHEMENLPQKVKMVISMLKELEMKTNWSNIYPVWKQFFEPVTKKKVHEFRSYSWNSWIEYFELCLSVLRGKYARFPKKAAKKILACFILDLKIGKYHDSDIKRQFRVLSKDFHPDLGGNAADFHLLQWAKDAM